MDARQQDDEARHAALMAVQGALTADERARFMARAGGRWPTFQLDCMSPADVLDYTTDYNEFLDETEVFFEEFGDAFPGSHATRMAAHVLLILGEGRVSDLSVDGISDLLRRAGVLDPEPEASPGEIGPAGFVHGRQTTAGERNELRHLLQVHMENVRTVRNQTDPRAGALGFSVGQWVAQWRDLKKDLDFLTEQMLKGA